MGISAWRGCHLGSRLGQVGVARLASPTRIDHISTTTMNQASGPKPTGSGESGLHFMKNRKSRGAAPGPGRAAESSAEKLRGCQHRRTRFARDGAELPPATFSGADSDRRRSRAKRLGCADATPAATHRNSPHTTTVCYATICHHNGCRNFGPGSLELILGRSSPLAFLASVPGPPGAASNSDAYIFFENHIFRRKIMIFAALFNFCADRAPGIS